MLGLCGAALEGSVLQGCDTTSLDDWCPTFGASLLVREAFFMDILTVEDETTALSRIVSY
jgi:hypothetical protein